MQACRLAKAYHLTFDGGTSLIINAVTPTSFEETKKRRLFQLAPHLNTIRIQKPHLLSGFHLIILQSSSASRKT